MPPLADPVTHFYGLFRKLSSTSQPLLSSCLLGALHPRGKLFWSDSSQLLAQPASQAACSFYFNLLVIVSVATSCCHLISLRSSRNRIYSFVILSSLWMISIGNRLNYCLHSFGFRLRLRSPSCPPSGFPRPGEGPLPYCIR